MKQFIKPILYIGGLLALILAAMHLNNPAPMLMVFGRMRYVHGRCGTTLTALKTVSSYTGHERYPWREPGRVNK